MVAYDFTCKKCGTEFEITCHMDERKDKAVCPKCGSHKVKQKLSRRSRHRGQPSTEARPTSRTPAPRSARPPLPASPGWGCRVGVQCDRDGGMAKALGDGPSGSTPACSAKVAWVCLRSCRRILGSIDFLTAWRNQRVTASGFKCRPSSAVKTRGDESPPHRQPRRLEVDVLPPQPEPLTATHADRRRRVRPPGRCWDAAGRRRCRASPC